MKGNALILNNVKHRFKNRMDFYANIMAALILDLNIFVFCFYSGGCGSAYFSLIFREREESRVSHLL